MLRYILLLAALIIPIIATPAAAQTTSVSGGDVALALARWFEGDRRDALPDKGTTIVLNSVGDYQEPPAGSEWGTHRYEPAENAPVSAWRSTIQFRRPLGRKTIQLNPPELLATHLERSAAEGGHMMHLHLYFLNFADVATRGIRAQAQPDSIILTFDLQDSEGSRRPLLHAHCRRVVTNSLIVDDSFLTRRCRGPLQVDWITPRVEVRLEPYVRRGQVGFLATDIQLLGTLEDQSHELAPQGCDPASSGTCRMVSEFLEAAEEGLRPQIAEAINDQQIQDLLALGMVGSLANLGVPKGPVSAVTMENSELRVTR